MADSEEPVTTWKEKDKAALNQWIDEFTLPFVDLKQHQSNILASDIKVKFDGFRKWAKNEVNKL